MTQYEKEFNYVEKLITKSVALDQIHHAQRTLRDFIDLWVIKVSPTDKKFIQDKNYLQALAQKKYEQISKLYL